MSAKTLSAVVSLVLLLGATRAEASTFYSVSDSAGPLGLTGFIETDSHTGILGSADITGWSLTVSGDAGGPVTVTPSNSSFSVCPGTLVSPCGAGVLTATATDLFFDFSSSQNYFIGFIDPGNVGIQYETEGWHGFGSGVFVVGVFTTDFDNQTESRAGNQIIASVSQTPLPAALPLFAGGFGVIGLIAGRRKRKAAATAAVPEAAA